MPIFPFCYSLEQLLVETILANEFLNWCMAWCFARAGLSREIDKQPRESVTESITWHFDTISGQYPHNVQCEWRIQAPQDRNTSVVIESQANEWLLEYHGDCRYDFVQIREGE